MNYDSSKSAKIVLSKSIFDFKNQPIFFQKNPLKWPCARNTGRSGSGKNKRS